MLLNDIEATLIYLLNYIGRFIQKQIINFMHLTTVHQFDKYLTLNRVFKLKAKKQQDDAQIKLTTYNITVSSQPDITTPTTTTPTTTTSTLPIAITATTAASAISEKSNKTLLTSHNNNNINSNNNTNNNNNTSKHKNAIELPKPRFVLYPRDKIRVGWHNSIRKWKIGAGMTNMGNTCYLNSTLQALLHVPSFANWLTTEHKEGHLDNCNDIEVGCTICAMIKTLEATQAANIEIRPHYISNRLKSICKQMVVGRQEDAHEFLRYLVASMERCYMTPFMGLKANLDQRSKETTPLNQIFGGYLRSAVRCLNCDYVSVTFQHFQDLVLDVAKAESIDQALDQFFSCERLEDMCYKCESCKHKVHATKQFSIECAPVTLCLQLKRFNPSGIKLNKLISLKPQLDITKFYSQKLANNDLLTYKLVAMISHLGQSPNCGHYTAIGLTESGNFYDFDDSFVSQLPAGCPRITNAYILFYEMSEETAAKQLYLKKEQTQIPDITTNATTNLKKLLDMNGATKQHSPVRVIGPELPPGGRLNYNNSNNYIKFNNNNHNTNYNNTNGNSANKPLSLINGKNESKLMIHFKNESAAVLAYSNTTDKETNNTHNNNNNINSYALTNGDSTTKHYNNNNYKGPSTSNGLSNGKNDNLSASENGHATPPWTKSSHTNGNNDDFDDNVVSSSAKRKYKADNSYSHNNNNNKNCPSMPDLGMLPTVSTAASTSASSSVVNINQKTSAVKTAAATTPTQDTTVSTTNGINKLVPYDWETDDDECAPTTTRTPLQQRYTPTTTSRCDSSLKRRINVLEDNNNNNNHHNGSNGNSKEITKAKTSYFGMSQQQQKEDQANNINNNNIRLRYSHNNTSNNNNSSNNNSSNNNSNNHNTNNNNFYTKINTFDNNIATTACQAEQSNQNVKQKHHQSQQPQKTDIIDEIFALALTNTKKSNAATTNGEHKKLSKWEIDAIILKPTTTNNNKKTTTSPTRNDVIKTTTGPWQVTKISTTSSSQAADTSVTEASSSVQETLAAIPTTTVTIKPKNPNNPFARATSADGRILNGKSYGSLKRNKSDVDALIKSSLDNGVSSKLLKQTHRGYGFPVKTWNNEQSSMAHEVNSEIKLQQKRELQEEEENEMDRGRQKKSNADKMDGGTYRYFNTTSGYNPFQNQENMRRFRQPRYFGYNRPNFQRNIFKYQRMTNKYKLKVQHADSSNTLRNNNFNGRSNNLYNKLGSTANGNCSASKSSIITNANTNGINEHNDSHNS